MGLHHFRQNQRDSYSPDQTIDMIFEKIPGGAGKFNTFLVNGKPYPHENEFVLKQGTRYRLVFRNRTDDAHPLHLHRHQFELVEINGTNLRHHKRHSSSPLLRPRRSGLYSRPAWPLLLSLPHSAAHGLWVQGTISLRLKALRRLRLSPSHGNGC